MGYYAHVRKIITNGNKESVVMAKNVGWNVYEKVLLMDAYNQVNEGNISMENAVTKVSNSLRQMAINSGREIDDNYWSEFDVAFQMNKFKYALLYGEYGLGPADRWCVDMYREDREKYEYILKEAKKRANPPNYNNKEKNIDENEEINISEDEKFKAWLKVNHPNYVNKIFSTFQTVDKYLQEWHVIDRNLLQIKEIGQIDLIIRQVRHNSGIQFIHKRNQQLFVVVLSAYRNYLSEQEKAQPTSDVVENQNDQKNEIEKSDEVQQSTEENKDEKEEIAKEDTPPDKISFKEWLIDVQGKGVNTANSYNRTICDAETYAKENQIGYGVIQNPNHPYQVKETIKALFDDDKFKSIDKREYHRFYDALHQYRKYLGISPIAVQKQDDDKTPYQPKKFKHSLKQKRPQTFQKKSQVEKLQDNDSEEIKGKVFDEANKEEIEKIKSTLQLPRFEHGFKIDYIELVRFRKSYKEVNGIACTLDDEALANTIREIGFEFDEKYYLISDSELDAIADEIENYKSDGINIIYYEKLYDLKFDKYNEANIVSAEMLKAILSYLKPEFRYRKRYFALISEKKTKVELIKNDILRVWGSDPLQTYDDLSLKLPFIPFDEIKSTLAQQSEFVWNSEETYLLADKFEADEQEIECLIDVIDKKCEEEGRASLDEISFDNLKDVNPELSDSAIISCFCKLVDDRFSRNAGILTRIGSNEKVHSASTAIVEFCRERDKCSLEQLKSVAKKNVGRIQNSAIVEAANSVMIRININEFIADQFVDFDVDGIDKALDGFIHDQFIGMREFATLSAFPSCGYSWNLFLLESYCRRFSKKYKYETRQSNSSNSGAIVLKTCNLSYHDIMAKAVARSKIELTEEEVFDFLIETGYMERKRYSKIDSLIKEATKLRERRK